MPALLGVVVRVRHLLEQVLAQRHAARRARRRGSPRREGDGEVVDDRRPAEQRRPLERHRDGAGQGVLLVLAGVEMSLPSNRRASEST